ncbi:DUF397 domain-containing protein [Actinomadura livida]|uniref:DUF397 domain-containing protein n=1 Tax=Actinomadura livida TaxID=79909 RepID=A0A7W7N282_9ACTN|nr:MULTISPECIES: DUF397 domain-containing protein [Actinomadura]MBB4778732.1 hypothetical protein [Actinomadura catellatispora]GGU36220.1 hypothetical protein GCM10010208_70940 [Actinomadura livida]
MIQWRKSRYSANSGQADCVEVARLAREFGIRDSKAPEVGHLTLTSTAFAELVASVKRNDLDR